MQHNNRKIYYSTWFIILWIIIFFPVGLYLLYKRYTQQRPANNSHTQSYSDSSARPPVNLSPNISGNQLQTLSRQQENEIINDIIIDDIILDDIIDRFNAIPNWKKYSRTIHNSPEQIIRMKRALYGGAMEILSFDSETGKAFVHGQSYLDYNIDAHGCSCEDFQRRNKPCKHMYFVAIYAPLNLPAIPLLFSEH